MLHTNQYAILCVSENSTTLTSLLRQLQTLSEKHISIEGVRSGMDAMDRITELEEDEIQLGILMIDQSLTDIEGTEFIKILHSSHPLALKILFSENPELDTVIKNINQHQLFGFLPSPWQTDELLLLTEKAKFTFQSQWKTRQENSQLKKQIAQLEDRLSERTTELLKKNLQLQQVSTTDALTQLPNRLKLDEQFLQAIKQSKRYQTPLSIILIDLDHFKDVNDFYGHQIGDDVLQELSELLKNNIRETDLVGRWGGEEFLIICPNLDSEHSEKLAEKLRQLIENHQFKTVGHKTASFGTSEFRQRDTEETMLERADKALYQAKGNGRNQIAKG